MYAQATLKRNIIPHNVAHRIVNRGVQKCTCAGASLRTKKYVPLNCINLGTATDPFLGSGSTLIAGEKTDHVCRGIEFDPKFVDVIVKRYIVNIKWLFCAEVEVFSCPILPKEI